MATLTGTFVSDLDAPPRRDPGIRGTPFTFNNTFITASARLGALGLLGWRRKRKAQAAA